jgi:hypothetical protein
MAAQKTVPEIIEIAKMSLTIAANKVGQGEASNGKVPDDMIHFKIYMELKAVEYWYSVDATSEYTRRVANYLYALCFPYNKEAEAIQEALAQNPPVVTGPSDLTVTDQATASFTVAVTSALAYTVQWYRNGLQILGATSDTYSFTADYDTDNGADFSAVVTNAAGSTNSTIATLTVQAQTIGHWYIGDTDYFAALSGGTDAITYNDTFDLVEDTQFSITVLNSLLANNKYHVYKYPSNFATITTWYNTALNNGQIPDQAFRAVINIGSWNYIVSRTAISFDNGAAMVFSGTNT